MRRTSFASALVPVAITLAAISVASCGGTRTGTLASQKQSTELVVAQAAPQLTPVDVDPPGPSVGDRLDFTAALTINGTAAGELTGELVAKTLGKEDGTSVVKEQRSGSLRFQFNASDSLEVSGTSRYKPKKKEMEVGDPQVRVVTGGTGAYAGAKGTVTTVHNADGTYTHTFTLTK